MWAQSAQHTLHLYLKVNLISVPTAVRRFFVILLLTFFMNFSPLIELGNVYTTPANLDLETYRYVLSVDPYETYSENRNFILSRIAKGRPKASWHLSIGTFIKPEIIDCMASVPFTEKELLQLTYTGKLSKEHIQQLPEVHHNADLKKKFIQL